MRGNMAQMDVPNDVVDDRVAVCREAQTMGSALHSMEAKVVVMRPQQTGEWDAPTLRDLTTQVTVLEVLGNRTQ